MSVFKGIIASLFTTFIIVFMVIFLVRLSNGKSAFIGTSDFYYYFQSVDLLKPFKIMLDEFVKQINSYSSSVASFGSIQNIGDFFNVLSKFIPSFFTLFTWPIQLIYYVLYFIGTLIGEIMRFFAFLTGNELTIL